MIRIIAVETDTGDALHIGGPVHIRHKTFEVSCEALEKWLCETKGEKWMNRSIVGVTRIEAIIRRALVRQEKAGKRK